MWGLYGFKLCERPKLAFLKKNSCFLCTFSDSPRAHTPIFQHFVAVLGDMLYLQPALPDKTAWIYPSDNHYFSLHAFWKAFPIKSRLPGSFKGLCDPIQQKIHLVYNFEIEIFALSIQKVNKLSNFFKIRKK